MRLRSGKMAESNDLPQQNGTLLAPNNIVNIKYPNFNPDSPETFFKVIEAYKTNYNLNETDMFLNLFVNLPLNIQAMVKHLLEPTAKDKITEFKKIIEQNFVPPIEDRIKKVILSTKMGDAKPSEYLRHIKSVIGENWMSYENLIRNQFLDSLASSIAPFIHLISPNTDLEAIALAADKSWAQQKVNLNQINDETILDKKIENITLQLARINQNNSPSNDLDSLRRDFEFRFNALNEQLKKSNALIENMKFSLDKLWQKSRDFSKNRQNFNRSRSRDRNHFQNLNSHFNSNDYCHFHKKFGSNAFRCVQPCTYKPHEYTTQGNVPAPAGQQM